MKLFPTLKSIIASSCGFLFLSHPLHAKDPTDIRFLSKADATEQHYVELLPSGFDAAKPLDVIIALHGHGSDRWQFIKDQRAECKGLRDVAEYDKRQRDRIEARVRGRVED